MKLNVNDTLYLKNTLKVFTVYSKWNDINLNNGDRVEMISIKSGTYSISVVTNTIPLMFYSEKQMTRITKLKKLYSVNS